MPGLYTHTWLDQHSNSRSHSHSYTHTLPVPHLTHTHSLTHAHSYNTHTYIRSGGISKRGESLCRCVVSAWGCFLCMQHCTAALHCTALYCTALYCTALYCTVLHCSVLHCTHSTTAPGLHSSSFFSDINECAVKSACSAGTCVNTVGSYICTNASDTAHGRSHKVRPAHIYW
jgi:hypothetical protein